MNRLFFIFLLILMSCSNLEPYKEPAPPAIKEILLQCWDGTIVKNSGDCPQIPKSVEISSEPEEANIRTESNVTIETESKETILKELLADIPPKFWFAEIATDDLGAIAIGEKRSVGDYKVVQGYFAAYKYWNTRTKELYLSAGQINEHWWKQRNNPEYKRPVGAAPAKYYPAFFKFQLTGDREMDRARIPNEIGNYYWYPKKEKLDITELVSIFYVKSPIDWMIEYQDETPIKVEESSQTIRLLKRDFQISKILHFKKKGEPNKTIVFRIDQEFNVPLVIDEYENYSLTKTYKYVFDKVWYKEGRKVEITQELVELPNDHIIITLEDLKQYLEDIEN